MSAKRYRQESASPLGRILQNTAWLLGGKGFGAICGLAYLAIQTRTLGLKDFGHFSLIFGTAQALTSLAGFQTWRVVVRYGSEHVHAKDWEKFGRLGMLCGVIDAVGAILGCGLAAILIFGFAHLLELNPSFIHIAFWYCVGSLWALVSAPTGIVRALNRFDMAVYVEAIVPSGRLVAALIIWFTGPTVGRFLAAWAAIDILEAILYWTMARRLSPQAVRISYLFQLRRAIRENPGVTQFFFVTYMGSAIDAAMKNGPLLVVGGWVGTKAAGLYRLASQLSQALSKLSTLLTRSVYAEVARVRVASKAEEFRKLALQTSLIAGGAGLAVVAVAYFLGEQLLAMIGGDAFESGASILIPLAVAASFDLASVAFEPVLHSTGKARQSLVARLIALAALGVGLWQFIPIGPSGAAWAVALAGATSYVAMGVMAWHTLRQVDAGKIMVGLPDDVEVGPEE
ncbi:MULTISPECIES: lipopolysaccharide biosynthesis protein [Novosphingobium]|jgi:O-antigen/teichoic acid export membrane protein|uniref:lipopolysaccharide biosynthesis protein n=1 Tax=Novosphingobium TaxID=165696 RepID=UPI001B3C8748|nr:MULTISPECIES: lipopolysaccharide biosynthesis protein [Novosphingobium]MBF7009982.1 lipopolysaccharide biosynthesis protein [Novosphingobium sp. HR1a]WJM28005.1 lipopolysaccharide biosynthesis protein [Novosphingobium resinovorum]GLK42896.1 membrane protein [Novosphingobium resinovorum]